MKLPLRKILFAALLLAGPFAFAQKATVSGYITDAQTGETLIGAGVIEDGKGAVTNAYGFYTLTLAKGRHSLTFSYVGYAEQAVELDLRRDTTINVALRPGTTLKGATVMASKDAGIESTKMSAIELPMQLIKHAPVLFGEHDVLKTIQLMPGVQSGAEGFSGIYVRGGGPEENLLLLDGIPLYNAEHLMGILSVFQPEAVKKATLYKGSFPARYGGRISSIIDIRTNDGNLKEFHGSVGVSALTDKVHLEGPVIKDKLAFSLSGRALHSFLYTPLIHKMAGTPVNYYFYDLNAKLAWRISDRDRLFANFYNGRDIFYYKDEGDESDYSDSEYSTKTSSAARMDINWGNTLGGLRWNHVFSSKLFSNATLAYTRYRMHVGMDIMSEQRQKDLNTGVETRISDTFRFGYESGMRDLTAKMDFDYTPTPEHLVKFGAEYVYHTFIPETIGGYMKEYNSGNVSQSIDTTFNASVNDILKGHEISVYAEDDFTVWERLTLNPGLHAAFFHTQGTPYWSIEPRMSAKYDFGAGFSAKAAYSRMAQYVHLLSPSSITLPTDLWVPITDRIRPVTSDQASLGVYWNGLKGWEFSLEGYLKWMHNILEYRDGTSFFGNSANWQNNVEMGEGFARGVELFVEKKTGRATGWLGYTLAWSDRRFPDGSINGGEWFPYRYDRRHNVSLVFNYDFGHGLNASATWTFASGNTMTLPERQTVVLTPDGRLVQQSYVSGRNNYRLPPSHRLNLGLSWTRPKRRGEAVWDLSVYNAYNAMNPNFVFSDTYELYDSEGNMVDSGIRLEKLTILPFIPSIGWTRSF
ncbi:MAG: TonB-dependent receptor [Bacteroidales bacterium]|nr:TonB-dependent receptor [Bacteroidales bacterium]